MNFYHFRPACKVIKRSRNSKGPFFTNFDDKTFLEILKNPEIYIKNGEVILENFGIGYHYSRKVFVGGLPSDITEVNVISTFSKFGPLAVDWPYKEDTNSVVPPKGFAFLLFETNHAVDKLVNACERKGHDFYLRICSANANNKNVQIRPWKLSGMDHVFASVYELNARHTIFVGGVPRTLSAEQLGTIISGMFGKVSYVGIDTDPLYLYPKGAARVVFENRESIIKAIKKRFLMPWETKTRKMMEIKPFILDDQPCDACDGNNFNEKFITLFCPEVTCLLYLCEFCWTAVHRPDHMKNHKPLVKQGLDDYMNSLKRRGFQP